MASAREPAPRLRSSPAHWATKTVEYLTRATTVNDPFDATVTSWNSHSADGCSRYETTTFSPPRAFASLPWIRTLKPLGFTSLKPFFVFTLWALSFGIFFVGELILSFDARPIRPPECVPNRPLDPITAKPPFLPAAATPKRVTFVRASSSGVQLCPPSLVRMTQPSLPAPNSGTTTNPCFASENDIPYAISVPSPRISRQWRPWSSVRNRTPRASSRYHVLDDTTSITSMRDFVLGRATRRNDAPAWFDRKM